MSQHWCRCGCRSGCGCGVMAWQPSSRQRSTTHPKQRDGERVETRGCSQPTLSPDSQLAAPPAVCVRFCQRPRRRQRLTASESHTWSWHHMAGQVRGGSTVQPRDEKEMKLSNATQDKWPTSQNQTMLPALL